MPIKIPQFAKNVDGLITNLQIKPTRAHRAEVVAWTQHPSFPKKEKPHGWRIKQVRDWCDANAEVIEELRKSGKKVGRAYSRAAGEENHGSSVASPHRSTGELPRQEHPAEGELFSDDLRKKQRLAQLQYIYDNPVESGKKLNKDEKAELRSAGLIPDSMPDDPGDFPTECTGAPALCRYYKLKFKEFNISVRRQYILSWQNGDRIPRNAPPHPKADDSGDYNLAECFAWYEKWKLPDSKISTTPNLDGLGQMPIEDLRDQDEREEIEHNRLLRQVEQGKYLPAAALEGFFEGEAARYSAHFDRLIEDKDGVRREAQEICGELGLSAEQALAFDAKIVPRLIARNDALKRTFQQIAADLAVKLEELKKPQE